MFDGAYKAIGESLRLESFAAHDLRDAPAGGANGTTNKRATNDEA